MANSIIIGIDHGFHLMKTKSQVFENGTVKLEAKPTFESNVICYRGNYYEIGTTRMSVKDSKIQDEDYFILTLAAIAEELMARRESRKARIILAVGIPFTRFHKEQQEFMSYLKRDKEICFTYEKEHFAVTIERVICFPQCYAAIANRLGNMDGEYVVCDIGSWTTDVMFIRDKIPVANRCLTLTNSIISMMQDIVKQSVTLLGKKLPESFIWKYISGAEVRLDDEMKALIDSVLARFAADTEGMLKENDYDMDFYNIVYVGGGASIMEHYGRHKDNILYLPDVRENAKGYEFLARSMERSV